MAPAELRVLVLRVAARVSVARDHLRDAEADLAKLSATIGHRHHSHTAVRLALREAESAEAVTSKLVETVEQIRGKP